MSQSTTNSNSARFVWIAAVVFIVLAGAAVMFFMRMSNAPADVDAATSQISANGAFKVSYTASPGQVPINLLHQWTLHLETATGQPVENAIITVAGDMPQHGHGMPTRPQVTEYLGDGNYLVEGMRFQMGGWWIIDFTIQADGQTDTVQFELMLK